MQQRQGFIGRGQELTQLAARLGDTEQSGVGSFVTVQGRSGVGKTALARNTMEYASSLGFDVSVVQCLPHRSHIPFWPLGHLIREFLETDNGADETLRASLPEEIQRVVANGPDCHDDDREDVEPGRLLKGIAELLQGRGKGASPVLLVFDDAQWCDPDTFWAMEALKDELTNNGIMLLLLVRDDLDDDWSDQVLRKVRSLSHHHLQLAPLTHAETARVAQMWNNGHWVRPSLIDELCDLTGGYPFDLIETLRLATGTYINLNELGSFCELPMADSVANACLARLDGLGVDSRRALSVIAVANGLATTDMLAEMLATSHSDVEGLVRGLGRRGLVEADEIGQLRVYHAFGRERFVDVLPDEERRRLHHGIGTHLAPKGRAWDTAHHLLFAGAKKEAYPHILEAARVSRRRGSLLVADHHYQTAREVLDSGPHLPEEKFTLLLEHEKVLRQIDVPEGRWRATLDELLQHAAQPEQFVESLSLYTTYSAQKGMAEAADIQSAEAVERAAAIGGATYAKALACRAETLRRFQRLDEAVACSDEVLKLDGHTPESFGDALVDRALMMASLGNYDEALQLVAQSRDTVEQEEQSVGRRIELRGQVVEFMVASDRGEAREAERLGRGVLRGANMYGTNSQCVIATVNLANLLHQQERLEEAHKLYMQAYRRSQHSVDYFARLHTMFNYSAFLQMLGNSDMTTKLETIGQDQPPGLIVDSPSFIENCMLRAMCQDDIPQLRRYISRMLRVCDGPYVQHYMLSSTLPSLIVGYAYGYGPHAAVALCDERRELISNVVESCVHPVVIAEAYVRAWAGDADRAVTMVESTVGDTPLLTYVASWLDLFRVSYVYEQAGQFTEAETWLKKSYGLFVRAMDGLPEHLQVSSMQNVPLHRSLMEMADRYGLRQHATR